MAHTVSDIQDDGSQWTVTYFGDDGNGYAVGITRNAVANRMGAYGFATSQEALLSLIHEFHWETIKPDPRDDPALIQGWVTSTGPEAERAHLYTTPVGSDSAAAHRCRMGACAAAVDLRDPDGLLPVYDPDPAEVQQHREMTDTFRWEHIYGGLPNVSRAPEDQSERIML